VRHVTRYALRGRGHLLVRRAHVEWDGAPVSVACRRRAALRRLGRRLLRVWIVAGTAFAAVRILRRIEIRKRLLHVVAAEALRSARDQRSPRRVSRREGGNLRGELMAYGTMANRLVLHLVQHDLRVALLVTSALAAGRASRLEAMHLRAVARHAFHVLERARIRLEVNAVPRRRPDALPRGRITRDVTRLADAILDRRVLADLVRPLLEPEVELPRAGEHGLRVARVARQLAVLVADIRELGVRRVHNVAGRAEVVRVLRVVPRRCSEARHPDEEHYGSDPEGPRRGAAACRQPGDDPRPVPDEPPDDDDGNDGGERDSCELNPLRDRAQEKARDRGDTARERGVDDDRVRWRRCLRRRRLLKRRHPEPGRDDGARRQSGHSGQR